MVVFGTVSGKPTTLSGSSLRMSRSLKGAHAMRETKLERSVNLRSWSRIPAADEAMTSTQRGEERETCSGTTVLPRLQAMEGRRKRD